MGVTAPLTFSLPMKSGVAIKPPNAASPDFNAPRLDSFDFRIIRIAPKQPLLKTKHRQIQGTLFFLSATICVISRRFLCNGDLGVVVYILSYQLLEMN